MATNRIPRLIQQVIEVRTGGNAALTGLVRAHLIVSGIHPDQHSAETPEDPAVVAKLEAMLDEFQRAAN